MWLASKRAQRLNDKPANGTSIATGWPLADPRNEQLTPWVRPKRLWTPRRKPADGCLEM
jgi:hypothetical protein